MNPRTPAFRTLLAICLLGAGNYASAFFAVVRTPAFQPIEGVKVTFARSATTAFSDAQGVVSFSHDASVTRKGAAARIASLNLINRKLQVRLPEAGCIDIHLYSLSGRAAFASAGHYSAGIHTLRLPYFSHGIYILQVMAGATVMVRKVTLLPDMAWHETPRAEGGIEGVWKRATHTNLCDTAFFTKSGFSMVSRVFAHYDDTIGTVFMDSAHTQPPVKAVWARNQITMFLKSDNSLWAAGDNSWGQLGDGTNEHRNIPVRIMDGVSSVSIGDHHTMILKLDHTLWATGNNNKGQLGFNASSKTIPEEVMAGVSTVWAAWDYTLVLKQDNTLWAMGSNTCGQLGVGDTLDRRTPTQVMTDVTFVSTGGGHTMILKIDGTLWATGCNYYGQLCDGTTGSKSSPMQIASSVSSVAAGDGFTMFIKQDGTLLAAGYNYYGQLGDGTKVNRATPVRIMSDVGAISIGRPNGNNCSMILKKDGTLWTAGENVHGEFGNGSISRSSSLTPIQVMSDVSTVLMEYNRTFVLKKDTSLWASGSNPYGALGDGNGFDRFEMTPVMQGVASIAMGGLHTMVLRLDGTLWAAGNDNYGQLCDGLFKSDTLFFKQVAPIQYFGLTVSGGRGSGSYQYGTRISISAFDSAAADRGFHHWGGYDSSTVLNNLNESAIIKMPQKSVLVKAVYDDLYTLIINGGEDSKYLAGSIVPIRAADSSSFNKVFDHWGGPDSDLVLNDTAVITTVKVGRKTTSVTAIYDTVTLVP